MKSDGSREPSIMTAGPIRIDLGQWHVTVANTRIHLTYREYLLLKELMSVHGKVVTREQLLQKVWQFGNAGLLETRTVDVHIARLRRKLGSAGNLIVTVRNVGYRMGFVEEWMHR